MVPASLGTEFVFQPFGTDRIQSEPGGFYSETIMPAVCTTPIYLHILKRQFRV